MRFAIYLILISIVLCGLRATSLAYTLTLNVSEDTINIQRPIQSDPVVYATRDVDIHIITQGVRGTWQLEVLALDDLLGPEPITANTISWEATQPPFIDGTLIKGTPQLMAQGSGDQDITGRVRFKYATANYMPGTYNLTVRYILSVQ